jgi:hypothetical protein
MGFRESVYLMTPNISACAPTGNKNQDWFVARLPRFDHSQRNTAADLHDARRSSVRFRACARRVQANADDQAKENKLIG